MEEITENVCIHIGNKNVKLVIVANVVVLNTNNSEGKGEGRPSRVHTLKQHDSTFLNSH